MGKSNSALRNPLGRVRGLGSAKEGTSHWWLQRVTSIALIPLAVLFLAAIFSLVGADWAQVRTAFHNPFVAIVGLLTVGTLFWHFKLGIQVVIEDYVHGEAAKIASLFAVKAAIYVVGLAAMLSIVKMFLGD